MFSLIFKNFEDFDTETSEILSFLVIRHFEDCDIEITKMLSFLPHVITSVTIGHNFFIGLHICYHIIKHYCL